MDAKKILKIIIDQHGSCDWASTLDICSKCPIGRMKRRANGDYYSCAESLNIDYLTDKATANQKYKYIAEQLYIDLEIDELLSD